MAGATTHDLRKPGLFRGKEVPNIQTLGHQPGEIIKWRHLLGYQSDMDALAYLRERRTTGRRQVLALAQKELRVEVVDAVRDERDTVSLDVCIEDGRKGIDAPRSWQHPASRLCGT